MRANLTGPILLAAGGLAWLVAATAKTLWTETTVCGSIAAGHVLLVAGLARGPRPALVATGFGVEAVAAALPWVVYGGVGLDFGFLWSALALLGFAAAAVAALRGPAWLARLGVAAGLPFAASNVLANELAGRVNAWSAGNVLILVGTVVTALLWSMPPSSAAVPGRPRDPVGT